VLSEKKKVKISMPLARRVSFIEGESTISTPPPSSNNINSNDNEPSPLAPAGGAHLVRSLSFSHTTNNSNDNNTINSSAVQFDPLRLEIHRKLVDQRHKNNRLAKTLQNVKFALRTKMERAEQSLMEAEDQFAQMSARNVKYIDDVSKYDSPKKSVLGIAPSSSSHNNSANNSRRSSMSRNVIEESGSINFTADHYHHKHHHHLLRNRRGSSSSLLHNTTHATSGAVNFQGIRRFGFAAAAMNSLATHGHCEQAQELIKLRDSSVPFQSLAPETHSLLIRNPLQISQLLRQFHDSTVDWAGEWKRLQNQAIENLCFIFLEEENHLQSKLFAKNGNSATTTSTTHHSILRDPRDDFMNELLYVAKQSHTLMEDQMRRVSDFVRTTLSAAVSELKRAKNGEENDGDDEDLAAKLILQQKNSPFDMAAAKIDHSKNLPPNRRHIAVQVGNNITVEDKLKQEIEDLRADYRKLQTESVQRQSKKETEIETLNGTVERLQSRLDLLHSCLQVQKQASTNSFASQLSGDAFLSSLKDSDLLTLCSSSSGFSGETQQEQEQIEKAMNAIRAEVNKALWKAHDNNHNNNKPTSVSGSASPVPVRVQKLQSSIMTSSSAFSKIGSASLSTNTSKECSPDQQLDSTQMGVENPVVTSQLPTQPITPPRREGSFSRRSSRNTTPVDNFSSLNTSAPTINDTSFTDESNNDDQRVTEMTTKKQQTFAATPPVKINNNANKPIFENNNNNNVYRFPAEESSSSETAGVSSARFTNSNKPKSASGSKRASVNTTPTITNNLPPISSGRGNGSGVALGSMKANVTVVKKPVANANNNKTPTNVNENTNGVSVSSSLKRMEEWKEHQAQLWQRRRSQLEKHSSYDGMLKLSASQQLLQQQQQQENQAVNSASSTTLISAAPVSPVQQYQNSFQHHDVLVDGSRRGSFTTTTATGLNNAPLPFTAKRR
jgi:hypothetical protein